MWSYRYNILIFVCFYSCQAVQATWSIAVTFEPEIENPLSRFANIFANFDPTKVSFGRFSHNQIPQPKEPEKIKNADFKETAPRITNKGVFTHQEMILKKEELDFKKCQKLSRVYGETGVSAFFKSQRLTTPVLFYKKGSNFPPIILTPPKDSIPR